MTQGKPWKVLLVFSIPLMLSGLIQQLYGLIDMAIVGNYGGVAGGLTGEQASAAVGASIVITTLFIMLGMGGSMGCGVVISQMYGGKRYAEVKTTVYTSLIFFTALALVMMGICAALSGWLTRIVRTPDEIYAPAVDFLRIYTFGLPFLFIYNVCNAIFNAMGDSKKPLYFLLFSSVLNMGIAYLFVAVFHWSVKGTAWATFIAQGIASLVSLAVLLKKTRSIASGAEKVRAFDMDKLRSMLRISVPSMIQMSIVSVGTLLVQIVANDFNDSSFLAGYNTAVRIYAVASTFIQTAGSAVSTFAAQNIGANRYDRVNEGIKSALAFTCLMSLALIAVVYLFGGKFVGMMIKEPSQAALDAGVFYLRVVIVGMLPFSFFNVFNGVARGAGYMPAFTISTLSDLGVRVAFAFAFAAALGENVIAISVVAGWAVGVAISTGFHLTGRWKHAKKI